MPQLTPEMREWFRIKGRKAWANRSPERQAAHVAAMQAGRKERLVYVAKLEARILELEKELASLKGA